MPNVVTLENGLLRCTCGASAKDNSAEAKRFHKRHPRKCTEKGNLDAARKEFTKQVAKSTKSVDQEFPLSDNVADAKEALASHKLDPRIAKSLRNVLENK
jgi:hypothetical protein